LVLALALLRSNQRGRTQMLMGALRQLAGNFRQVSGFFLYVGERFNRGFPLVTLGLSNSQNESLLIPRYSDRNFNPNYSIQHFLGAG